MTTDGAGAQSSPETCLLLLPGMDGTSLLFEPFMEVASQRRPVTAIRYPDDGTGRTYAALEPFVLDRLPTTRPYVIVAESFSGPLALRSAAKRPPGLRGVVLCATFVKPPRPLLTWFARWPGATLAMRAAGRLGGPFVRSALIGRDAPPALRLRTEWVLAQCVDPECLAARAGEISRVDAERDLVAADCPILCIRGLRDRVVPASAARRMAELRPDITMAEVDAPHGVLQTRPRQCLDLIETFIGSLPLPAVTSETGAEPGGQSGRGTSTQHR